MSQAKAEIGKQSKKMEVINAIEFNEVNKLPKGELILDPIFVKNLLNKNFFEFEDDLIKAAEILDLNLIIIEPVSEIDIPYKIKQANMSNNMIPCIYQFSTENISHLSKKSDLFIFGMVKGPFEAAYSRYGFSKFMCDIKKNVKEIDLLMEEVIKSYLDLALKCIDNGVDGIIIADDLAFKRSTFLSPEMLRQRVFPHLQKEISSIRDKGVYVFFHSDGNYSSIVHDLVKMELDGLHCLDDSCGMSYQLIREEFGINICIMGDMNADLVLGQYSDEAVKVKVINELASPPRSKGYIFGTCSGIPNFARVTQVQSLYKAADIYFDKQAYIQN